MFMKSSFCNEPFQEMSFEQGLEIIAAAGYDAVEIAPFTLAEDATKLSSARRAEIRKTITKHGLAVAGLHWLLVKPDGLHLTTPDARVRLRTVEFLEGLISLCADLEGSVLVWGSPNQRSIAPDQNLAEVRGWVLEYLVRLARRASSCGITFCVEPLSSDQTNFINRPEEAVQLVQEAGCPDGLGIILDAYSSSRDEIDIAEELRRHFSLVKHIHVNDTNKQGPGMGDYDFGPLIATAGELGYQGYISCEPFDYSPGPGNIARISREYLRRQGL
jgi:sugar phosphate isomerase/epimerase